MSIKLPLSVLAFLTVLWILYQNQIYPGFNNSHSGGTENHDELLLDKDHDVQVENFLYNISKITGKACYTNAPYSIYKEDRYTFILLNSFRVTNGNLEILLFIEDDTVNDWDHIIELASPDALICKVSYRNISLKCKLFRGATGFHIFCQLPDHVLQVLEESSRVHEFKLVAKSREWKRFFLLQICFRKVVHTNDLTLCVGPVYDLSTNSPTNSMYNSSSMLVICECECKCACLLCVCVCVCVCHFRYVHDVLGCAECMLLFVLHACTYVYVSL